MGINELHYDCLGNNIAKLDNIKKYNCTKKMTGS